MLFDVQRRERDGWTVLAVTGELDLAAAPQVRQAVLQIVPPLFGRPPVDPPRVVIDLSSVDFLDSAGLGVVLGAVRRARAAGGSGAIVVASPPVRDLFAVLGLANVIPVRGSLDEIFAGVADGDLEPPGSPLRTRVSSPASDGTGRPGQPWEQEGQGRPRTMAGAAEGSGADG